MCVLVSDKILNNHVDILPPDYIMKSIRVTRGNDRKFILPPMNIDVYKFSFYPIVIGLWNNLPPEIANSPTSDDFKNSYVTGYWKTDHNFTLGQLHFIGPANSHTHALSMHCCITGLS